MKSFINKLFSISLVLTMIMTQSANLGYNLYAYSELDSEIANQETSEVSEKNSDVKSPEEGSKTETEGQRSEVKNAAIKQASTTISVPEYNATTGWNNGDIYTVSVTADFTGDTTTTGKNLIVELPHGMTYQQISVVPGKYNTDNIKASALANLGDSDPLTTGITQITLPSVGSDYSVTSSYYGAIKYEFAPGVEKATLSFKVSVDQNIFYAPKDIANAIKATTLIDTQVQSSQSFNVKAVGSIKNAPSIYVRPGSGTSEVIKSTSGSINTGKTSRGSLKTINLSDKTMLVAVKNVKYYIYYPSGMEFDSFQFLNMDASKYTVTQDAANSRIIVDFPHWYVGEEAIKEYQITYKVPVGKIGQYTAPKADYVEFEYYDGTKSTVTGPIQQVKVIDSVVNSLFISQVGSQVDSSIGAITPLAYFYVSNETAGPKTNQVAHFTFDKGMDVYGAYLPFDPSSGSKVTSVEYKTNLNSGWRSLSQEKLNGLTSSGRRVKIDKGYVGLASNEYFTEIKANVGNFSEDIGTPSWGFRSSEAINAYGKLQPGYTSSKTTLSMYDANNKDATIATNVSNVADVANGIKTIHLNSTLQFKDISTNSEITQITAGNTFKVSGAVNVWAYQYGSTYSMRAPRIHIREVDGMKVNTDSIVLKMDGVELTDYKVVTSKNANGETVYTIETSADTVIGMQKDESWLTALHIDYNVTMLPRSKGNFDIRELVAYSAKGYGIVALNVGAATPNVVDVNDINGNGNVTEILHSMSSKKLMVQENKNVLVETFLSLAGEEAKDPYVEGNKKTVAYFTPGTNADYTVKVTNNGGSAAEQFTAFVPIPKTGQNFGALTQEEDFKWDMSLSKVIPAPSGFEVLYATNANESNLNDAATFKTAAQMSLSDYAKVNLIKIVSTAPFAVGAEVEFKVSVNIAETFESATNGNKIGTRNIYNPVYRVVSETFTGVLPGTKVGTELSIPEIGGTVFLDTDGNGLNESNDELIAGHEVELYVLNETTGKYEPKLDGSGSHITTTTKSDGTYLFDYTKGLTYETYAVRFVEKTGANYEYTVNNNTKGNEAINSDAIIANDIPNPGDQLRGWVVGIEANLPEAKTVGAGFIAYNPPIDLKLDIDLTDKVHSTKVGDKVLIKPESISPDFWYNIKDEKEAYKWELVNATDSQYVTLGDTNKETVTVIGNEITPKGYTVELKLTIKDIYGATKSDTTNVRVTPLEGPTVTAPDLVFTVGDEIDFLHKLEATDYFGDNISFVTTGANINTVIDDSTLPTEAGKVIEPGTYGVKYSVTSDSGNTTQVTRKVLVNSAVVIEATNQEYMVTDSEILTKIANAANATFLKASATIGEEPVVTTVNYTTDYLGNSFDAFGVYAVKYSATNEFNNTADKQVKVVIKDENSVSNADYLLTANGFTIDVADVPGMDMLTLSGAKAINIETELATDVIFTGTVSPEVGTYKVNVSVAADGTVNKDIYVKVTNSGVVEGDVYSLYGQNAVINLSEVEGLDIIATTKAKAWVTENGDAGTVEVEGTIANKVGVNKITLSVKEEPTLTKVVFISVIDQSTVVDENSALHAENFIVDITEVESLTDETILLNANASAWILETGEELSVTITKNMIKNEVGTYPVTLENSMGLSKVIYVKVTNSAVVEGDTYSLYGQNAVINLSEVEGLDVIATTKAKAWVTENGEAGTVEFEGTVAKKAGVNKITLRVVEEPTLTKEVYITVIDEDTVTDMDSALFAQNFTIDLSDVKTLTNEKIITNSNAHAWQIDNGEVLSVLVKENGIESKVGTYPVTLENSMGLSKVIYVTVISDDTVINGNVAVDAGDFTITTTQAKELNDNKTIKLSNAIAWSTLDGKDLSSSLSVNKEQLAKINIGKVGTYEMNISATDGNDVATKAIKVNVVEDDKDQDISIKERLNLASTGYLALFLTTILSIVLVLLTLVKRLVNNK